MGVVPDLLKLAHTCHSKQAWEAFFRTHQVEIATNRDAQLLRGIFHLFQRDPLCRSFAGGIAGQLLSACHNNFFFDLGKSICLFGAHLTAFAFAHPASHLLLECGEYALAQRITLRSLRLASHSEYQRAALHLSLAQIYAYEGHKEKVSSLLMRVEKPLRRPNAAYSPEETLKLNFDLGKLHDLCGNFREAFSSHQECAERFASLNQRNRQAEALLLAGQALNNLSADAHEQSRGLLLASETLALEFLLEPILSYLREIEGERFFRHGRFSEAQLAFRSARDLQPPSRENYRRHILEIKLVFCHLAKGQTKYGIKLGHSVLKRIKLQRAPRLQALRIKLETSLAWESGNFKQANRLLGRYLIPLSSQKIKRPEELELFAHLYFQSSLLGLKKLPYKLPQQFLEGAASYAGTFLTFSRGLWELNQDNYGKAQHLLGEAQATSARYGYRYVEALALDGLIQLKLLHHQLDLELDRLVTQFIATLEEFDSQSFRPLLGIIQGARAYQAGEFALCCKKIRETHKLLLTSPLYAPALHCWRATLDGKNPGHLQDPQMEVIARLTRHYFAPTVEQLDASTYLIAGHYRVSLGKNALLQALLHYILLQPDFAASLPELQKLVWHQSLQTAGWGHKIRNAFIRLRILFPFTIAPLILRNRRIRIFHQAIAINFSRQKPANRPQQILGLLQHKSMSSQQLRCHLALSPASTKRILALLIAEEVIQRKRVGRSYEYSRQSEG